MKATQFTKSALAALVLAGSALPAFAQSTWSGTWDWAAPCDPTTCVVMGSTGSVTSTISALSTNSLGSNFGAATFTSSGSYLGIRSAGTESTGSPHHAIDNVSSSGGVAEALAINFSQAVNLTNVAVSWTYSDSDAMIFRWDGAAAPGSIKPNDLPGAEGATSNSWTLVRAGQFAPTGPIGASGSLTIADTMFSSYWLVSTWLGGTNDAFKVSSFTGDVCKYTLMGGLCKPPGTGVPEPTSLALVGLALLGVVGSRRRRSLMAR